MSRLRVQRGITLLAQCRLLAAGDASLLREDAHTEQNEGEDSRSMSRAAGRTPRRQKMKREKAGVRCNASAGRGNRITTVPHVNTRSIKPSRNRRDPLKPREAFHAAQQAFLSSPPPAAKTACRRRAASPATLLLRCVAQKEMLRLRIACVRAVRVLVRQQQHSRA